MNSQVEIDPQIDKYKSYAREIIDIFAGYGLTADRFTDYLRFLEEFEEDNLIVFNPERQMLFGQALREVAEVYLILKKFYSDRSSVTPVMEMNLKRIVRGSTLAQDDENDGEARNLQFQYFVAAVLKDECLEVQVEDPSDFNCVLGDIRFANEAKRIKSYKRIRDNFKKAREQIERQNDVGVVWISIDLMVNPNFSPFYSEGSAEIESITGQILASFYTCFEDEVPYVGPRVTSLVLSFWSWHLPKEYRSWIERRAEFEEGQRKITFAHSWQFSIIELKWEGFPLSPDYKVINVLLQDKFDTSMYLGRAPLEKYQCKVENRQK